jgi:type II secretory ATPase GspE/PulE/Tfp pilus assembly ATPase PilB-like protein
VRKLTDTKEEYVTTKTERDKIASEESFDAALKALREEKLVKEKDGFDKVPFYHPVAGDGEEDGYKSRIGIHEVLAVSPAIRDIIIHSSTSDAIEAQAKKEGMLSMLEDGIYKAARGITSLEEVLRAISE